MKMEFPCLFNRFLVRVQVIRELVDREELRSEQKENLEGSRKFEENSKNRIEQGKNKDLKEGTGSKLRREQGEEEQPLREAHKPKAPSFLESKFIKSLPFNSQKDFNMFIHFQNSGRLFFKS